MGELIRKMTDKFLEVNFGPGVPAKTFQLTEVQDNTFMLATRDSVIDLVETYTQWLQKNFMIRESRYQQMIQLRAGLIHDLDEGLSSLAVNSVKFTNESLMGANEIDDSDWTSTIQRLQVGQPQNAEEMMLEERVDSSDNLFIGCVGGTLLQWSISEKKVIKEYGEVMISCITALRTTADKKHLFISDRNAS